jgi:class 3 adenylate cyclase
MLAADMTRTSFRLYRYLGAFWLSRAAAPLARFAQSRAYEPLVAAAFAAGISVIAAGAVILPFAGYSGAALAIFGLGAVLVAALLMILTSRGRTATAALAHPDPADLRMRRCASLLQAQGFTVTDQDEGRLHAQRGGEKDGLWRSFPLEVQARAQGQELWASCTAGGGAVFEATRRLVQETATGIAALDGRALHALDDAPVLPQRAWFLGGLAGTVFNALLLSTLAGVAATAGLAWFVTSRALELEQAELVNQRARSTLSLVQQATRVPLRLEAARLLANVKSVEALKLRLGREGLVVALRDGEGRPVLIHPRESDELQHALAERGLQRLGERVLLRLTRNEVAPFEAALDMKPGTLLFAEVLSLPDLARRLPRLASTELTLYRGGAAMLRYAWDEKGAGRVEAGGASIPREVLRARMQVADEDEESTMVRRLLDADLESFRGSLRGELRDGVPYTVYYAVREAGGAGSGWRGFAFAAPSAAFETETSKIMQAAALVGVLGLAAILFLVQLVAFFVARRISRPVIEVQGALRTIADGNYAARVAEARTDEIGQLQRLVNRVADELRRRDAMREMMGKYLSKQVADQILAADPAVAFAGQRREVSVLFADVRGFTTYSEKHDPEQVTRTLNEYFEVMVDVIASHEGVLDKYIGDGLMVVFGAPVPQPDHARRAVITALEMQAALHTLNLKRAQRGDDPIAIGAGVNTGVVISGNLGSLKRMEFTVVGDTVNLAARLESRALQGQVLIGEATYRVVRELVEAESLGPMPVKGKAEPVPIWLVKGLRSQKPRA